MPRNQNRGGRRGNNNNPQGRNQYSNGMMDIARERPVAAAAAAAAAVGAGVFLWSKRSQISDQLTNLSEQIGEWTENLRSDREFEMAGGESQFGGTAGNRATGDFGTTTAARTTRATPSRSNKSTGTARRSPSSSSIGSGTMSGGSLDTGPSGRGGE